MPEETERTAGKRKRASSSPAPEEKLQASPVPTKKKPPKNTIEFRPFTGDQDLARKVLEQQGDEGPLTAVYKQSLHEGLILKAALMGPDYNGLYAGRYSLDQMAQLVRQWGLGLTDLINRSSTPLSQMAVYSPYPPHPGNGGPANPLKEAGFVPPETKIDEQGAASLKGLGTGLLKKRTPPASS